jgi:phosphate transport system substrate-binding protein
MKRLVTALAALSGLAGMVSAQTLINGSGATFPEPMYTKWFSEFKKTHPTAQINYTATGSGAGVKAVTDGTVDFGASDAILTDEQLKAFSGAHGGSNLLCFPTVMGAAVLTYNVAGVSADVKLTPDAIAGIYLGKITKWNDPAIAKANPGVSLPSKDIVVTHRSDASGTTFVFTDYLSKVSPEWKMKVGPGSPSIQWPVGLGGKGSDGVAGLVKQQANSIGYVELAFAVQNKMNYATIVNAAGKPVKPSLESVTAAAAGSLKAIPDDFRVSITNAPGNDSYPISTFTWLLIPDQLKDANKKKALTDFLTWMLKDGQALAPSLTFAPLPKAVVDKEVKAIAKIK